jgi:hypothetical protein
MNELSGGERGARASSAERDAAILRIQAAFAEGRIEEQELERRLREALDATHARDLEPLIVDLPQGEARPPAAPARESIRAYGSRIERTGRWTIPSRLVPTILKGHLLLDLRAAHLASPEAVVHLRSYKSTIEIVVPPGVDVEWRGFAYKGTWSAEPAGETRTPGRKTIRLRGIAYKSRLVVRKPAEPA